MSVNDEILYAGSDSFWDVGGYKDTVKRCEDGLSLTQKLSALVQERADIEKHYATELKEWSKKWNKFLETGPEYGTSKSQWQAFLSEADSVADLHLDIKTRLSTDVQNNLKQWRSDKYHKSVMGQSKETKQFDDDFKKAQKSWAKKLSKVLKTKKDFHAACKAEKTAIHQEGNARNDSSVSPEQLKKLQQKVEKCKDDVDSTRKAYESALNEINDYNARYMEDMTEVFHKTQDFEDTRLQFFQSVFLQIHSIVNISANAEFPRIFEQFRQTVQACDSKKDLKWWSQNHGVDMSMAWPKFEDYSPEFHDISKKKHEQVATSGILLKKINTDTYQQEFPEYSTEFNTISREKKQVPVAGSDGVTLTNMQQPQQQKTQPPAASWSQPSVTTTMSASNRTASVVAAAAVSAKFAPPPRQPSYDPSLNPFGESPDETDHPVNYNSGGGNMGEQNPFGNDWEDDEDIDENNGVVVKALYDHAGQEEDELSFKAGDIFVKLKDRDELGWCTGKKDGKIGLFPDNYVEPINK